MGKRPRGAASSASGPATAKCFLGGLSQMTDSDKLVKYFETKYAPYKVEMCEVMYDRHTTRSRGFGFVTMDVRAVAAAVDDQARDKFCHQLDGKHFEVRPATPVGASPPPAPPGVGIVNRPAGDLDALLTGAPARAPAFQPSAPRPGGYQMPPPNGAMYAPPPPNFGLKDVCRDFQNGRCTRGDSCKYVHAAPGAPPSSGWMPPAAPSAPPPATMGPPTNGWRPPDVGPPLGGSPRSSGFAAAPSSGASGWRPPDVGPPLGGGFGGGSPRNQTYAPPPSSGGPSDAVSAALQAMRAIEGNLKRQRVAPAAPAAPAMPYMPGIPSYDVSPAQRCSDWIAAAGVDGAASSLFNESPLAVKLAAMDAGPVTGSNPSACLVARVIRLKKAHRDGGLPNREF
mmetsp:Transcript_9137/g.28465  ORF Transcript_9137/g.28465 Transcript_9137/m.28465 type:complete len:397 (-) Transcript_9137:14-1204(-)